MSCEPEAKETLESNDVLKRLGLSEDVQRDDFAVCAHQEVSDALSCLEDMRRKAMQQVARCEGQLDIVGREIRAEEERRLISERVSKELDKFRDEMRQKEIMEEERIKHVYRSIAIPSCVPEHKTSDNYTRPSTNSSEENRFELPVVQAPHQHKSMPIIASSVTLLQSPRPETDHRSVHTRSRSSSSRQRCSSGFQMPTVPDKMSSASRSSTGVLPRIAHDSGRARSRHKEAAEANMLLERSLARLRQLDRLGV